VSRVDSFFACSRGLFHVVGHTKEKRDIV